MAKARQAKGRKAKPAGRKRGAPVAVAPDDAPLTPKQEQFCREYLIDLNAAAAAERAGYSADTARQIGYENLTKPYIADRIAVLMAERAKRTQVEGDDVLRRFWHIAIADANELIEFRRTCCRHCYGDGFRYQRTQGEMEAARAQYRDAVAETAKGGDAKRKRAPEFDEMGGAGYDARKPPNPDCPECFGEGVGQPFAKDTRGLSPTARLLYAGIKVTKDGLEIRTHDQMAALVNVGKLIGAYTDKLQLTGKDGTPLIPLEALRAAAAAADKEDAA